MLSTHKKEILNIYKDILRQTKYIQNERQKHELYEKTVKEFKSLSTTSNYEEILSKAQKHLSFLKLITPKIPTKSERKVFIIKEGNVEQVEQINRDHNGKAISNWGMGNIDPDQMRKHEYLLRRQHFEVGPLKDYPKRVHGIPTRDE